MPKSYIIITGGILCNFQVILLLLPVLCLFYGDVIKNYLLLDISPLLLLSFHSLWARFCLLCRPFYHLMTISTHLFIFFPMDTTTFYSVSILCFECSGRRQRMSFSPYSIPHQFKRDSRNALLSHHLPILHCISGCIFQICHLFRPLLQKTSTANQKLYFYSYCCTCFQHH